MTSNSLFSRRSYSTITTPQTVITIWCTAMSLTGVYVLGILSGSRPWVVRRRQATSSSIYLPSHIRTDFAAQFQSARQPWSRLSELALINTINKQSSSQCYLSTEEKNMQKTVLFDVLETFKECGIVTSEGEFSKDWLHRSDCYLRTCRFKGVEPSVSSIAVCASKLQHYGRRMSETEKHAKLGEKFLKLSEACHNYINERATSVWMPS